MLSLFSTRVDHPLADAKEARRVLAALPALEGAEALESAAAWCDSLAAAPEFPLERRLDLLLQLDAAVLPQSRRLARDYLTAIRPTRARAYRQWQLGHGYWSALAAAYRQILASLRDHKDAALPPPLLALLFARLLHADGARLKWDHFRHGPIDGEFWLATGTAYLEAMRRRVADRATNMTANGGETTAEAEYLKILILQASSMDNLLPLEIEIAERLITHLLPSFSLTDEARPENVYWVDCAKPLPPTRLAVIPSITPTLRFFATAPALATLAGLRESIESRGTLPAEVNFGGQYSPRVVLPVIAHLATCWAPLPPMRGHQRRAVKSRMTVVHGLAAVRQELLGLPCDTEAVESWVVDDVSQGGLGAQAVLTGKDWLKVGLLVGMRPAGGSNWLVGVVRRFCRVSESTGSVGIETLSKAPRGLTADGDGLSTEVIALDSPAEGGEIRLVLPVEAWEEQRPLVMAMDGRRWRLFPGAPIEIGTDSAIGRYRAELAA